MLPAGGGKPLGYLNTCTCLQRLRGENERKLRKKTFPFALKIFLKYQEFKLLLPDCSFNT